MAHIGSTQGSPVLIASHQFLHLINSTLHCGQEAQARTLLGCKGMETHPGGHTSHRVRGHRRRSSMALRVCLVALVAHLK